MLQTQIVQKLRDKEKKVLDLELEYKMKAEKAKRLRQFINSKIAFNFEINSKNLDKIEYQKQKLEIRL